MFHNWDGYCASGKCWRAPGSRITSAGVDVHLLNCLNPGVSFLIRHLGLRGIMVSASHNSLDNGLKFFNSQGHKLNSRLEEEVERLYFQEADSLPRPSGEEVGRSYRSEKIVGHYLSFLEKHAPSLRGIKAVLDCANGSLYRIAPRLFRNLGAEVISLSCNPDGLNINVNCGSTSPEKLQAAVKRTGRTGLALTGTETGSSVDGKGAGDGDAVWHYGSI